MQNHFLDKKSYGVPAHTPIIDN